MMLRLRLGLVTSGRGLIGYAESGIHEHNRLLAFGVDGKVLLGLWYITLILIMFLVS